MWLPIAPFSVTLAEVLSGSSFAAALGVRNEAVARLVVGDARGQKLVKQTIAQVEQIVCALGVASVQTAKPLRVSVEGKVDRVLGVHQFLGDELVDARAQARIVQN